MKLTLQVLLTFESLKPQYVAETYIREGRFTSANRVHPSSKTWQRNFDRGGGKMNHIYAYYNKQGRKIKTSVGGPDRTFKGPTLMISFLQVGPTPQWFYSLPK